LKERRETEEPTALAPWTRWLMPSVTDLTFILLLISMMVGALAPRLLGDAGTGWHIRNGELMLRTHAITRSDPFSSVTQPGAAMSGRPWYAWEWLYDISVAALDHRVGLNGVVALTALAVAFTFALAFRITLKRGGGLLVTTLLLGMSLWGSAVHLQARPHVFSWMFAVVGFEILDSAERAAHRYHRLFWLLPLMLLWVNTHGAFVLGFVLLGIYLIGGIVEYYRRPQARESTGLRLRYLALVTGLSLLISLVNPYGYGLIVHVYDYLSNHWLMSHIDEFRSPDFRGLAQQSFAGLVLLAILALSVRGEELSISQLLVVAFATYSGLYATRNLPISSLFLTLVSAPILSRALTMARQDESLASPMRRALGALESFSRRMQGIEAGLRGHLWPILAVLAAVLICLQQGKLGDRQWMNAHFDARRFPIEAAKFIAQRRIPGPIFSPDAWGGYLIYQLYPATRVYVDDRHDFYGTAFLKNYLKVLHVAPDWRQTLEEMQVRWVLVPAQSSLAGALRETPDWAAIHEDQTAVLFEQEGRR
jgi:hypothetical protein